MNPRFVVGAAARVALGLGIAALGGVALAWLRTPLPWLLGPLAAVAAAQRLGLPLALPERLRHAGQWVVGTAVGLNFVPEVARATLALWPVVLVNVTGATLLALGGAWLLHRATHVDLRTCFFSTAIGGGAEMLTLAERFGADADKVAAAHALRIALVALTVPAAFSLLGVEGEFQLHDAERPAFAVQGFALVAGLTVLGAMLAERCSIPNAWALAPMLVAAGTAATGLQSGTMPDTALHAGQLLVGWAMGSRFTPGFFDRAPKFVAAVAGCCLALLGITAGLAVLAAQMIGGDSPSLVLATVPGGVAEMSLTARLLALDVPLVTTLHLTRVVVAAAATAPLFALLLRFAAWWRTADAAARRRR